MNTTPQPLRWFSRPVISFLLFVVVNALLLAVFTSNKHDLAYFIIAYSPALIVSYIIMRLGQPQLGKPLASLNKKQQCYLQINLAYQVCFYGFALFLILHSGDRSLHRWWFFVLYIYWLITLGTAILYGLIGLLKPVNIKYLIISLCALFIIHSIDNYSPITTSILYLVIHAVVCAIQSNNSQHG